MNKITTNKVSMVHTPNMSYSPNPQQETVLLPNQEGYIIEANTVLSCFREKEKKQPFKACLNYFSFLNVHTAAADHFPFATNEFFQGSIFPKTPLSCSSWEKSR